MINGELSIKPALCKIDNALALSENTSTFADTRIPFQLYMHKEPLCSAFGKKLLDQRGIVLHTLSLSGSLSLSGPLVQFRHKDRW